jgi:hypothetical protein
VITVTFTGTAGDNNWFRSSVTVKFNVSGEISTSGCDTVTFTTEGTRTLHCIATASDGSSASSDPIVKVDLSAPTVTSANPSRAANTAGWYNAPVTVTFSGSDTASGSGIASCTQTTYGGPESSSATVQGSCRDNAGWVSPASTFALKYDSVKPQVSASPDRAPNATGWYRAPVTVSFRDTAPVTSPVTCDSAKTYSVGDSANANVSGNCTDQAGNSATGAATFGYDATKPTVSNANAERGPDNNNWYNKPLKINFTSSDATSGIAGTCSNVTYSAPESATAGVNISCSDNAGNVSDTVPFGPFKYDATKPQVAATADRAPNVNGWYRSPVTVSFRDTATVTTAPVTCDGAKTYSGGDSSAANVSGNCSDQAGNSATGGVTLHYDATPPAVTATPDRAANGGGWYRAPVSVSFRDTAPVTAPVTCDNAKTYSGGDSASVSVTGNCADAAGNQAGATASFKYDATAPVVTATPDRAPNATGWYRAPVTVTFNDSAAVTAPVTCDAAKTYSGADSQTANVSGSCSDAAGNTGTGAATFGYDATKPSVSNATAERSADNNGWYNKPLKINFASSDATSRIAGDCTSITYSGPDTASAAVNITCRDNAGNVSDPLSFGAFKYDATKPAVSAATDRVPDGNGWYRAPVTVTFRDTSPVVAPVSCDGAKSYSGGDTATANVTGNCTDAAGNSAAGAATFGYDATAPTTTGASADRGSDSNGWYNHALTVNFAGTDATSGIESCSSVTYDGPDSSSASVAGGCRDRAGNIADGGSFGFQFDATAPSVRGAPTRGANANGWYNQAVTVEFGGSDGASGVQSCTSGTYAGPDSASGTISGSCTDRAGNVGGASIALRYDATPPAVEVRLARAPDGAGWYRRAVALEASGTDGASGVETCTGSTYDGPDATTATLSGSCRDAAGNSASRSLTLRYDSTAPTLRAVVASPGNHLARLTWSASDADSIRVMRTAPGRSATARYLGDGTSFVDKGLDNGTRYRYVVTAADAAGNTASSTVAVVPLALFEPAQGARVAAPPLFQWAPVPRATYYNVQVLHKGKVLSAWPAATRMRMPERWTFRGRSYRLAPGLYRWYVWPGFGERADADYGPRVGGSFFVVVQK